MLRLNHSGTGIVVQVYDLNILFKLLHLKPNGGTSETPYLYRGLTFLLQFIAIILKEFSHLFTNVYQKTNKNLPIFILSY